MIMKANTTPSNRHSDPFISDLMEKVNKAVESREANDIAIVQLEVQFAMLEHLQRMDWKLWELYNKFGI